MVLNTLNNGEMGFLQEELRTTNNFIIPKGTKVRMVNKLNATAIIDLLPTVRISGEKRIEGLPVYKRCIVASYFMHTKIKTN